MITYLRKLRKSFINAGASRKYMLYAIGEIALVVIGILIALQINNWNTQQQNNSKESLYLQAFKSDLEANRDELKRVIGIAENTVSQLDSLLRMTSREGERPNPRQMAGLILRSSAYTIFLNKAGTIKEIFESGDLKVIRNDSLRAAMASWEADIDEIRSYELPNTDAALASFNILKNHMNFATRFNGQPALDRQSLDRLVSDRAYINGESVRIYHFNALKEFYVKQLRKVDSLLEIIEREI